MNETLPSVTLHTKRDIDFTLDIDVTPGKQPSTMQIIKLAASPKFRGVAKRVMEELKKAGIDITPEVSLFKILLLVSMMTDASYDPRTQWSSSV